MRWDRRMDTPAQQANVFGHDNIIVQASGSGVNVTVEAGRPYLRLTQYERRTKLAARDNSEAALLSAYRSDVVPLVGREREMADLRLWLEREAPVSVRVLVGARRARQDPARAGTGARDHGRGLARGICQRRRTRPFSRAEPCRTMALGQAGPGRRDYAASRAAQIAQLGARTRRRLAGRGRPRFRLLLLERQANRAIGWFATVFGLGNDDNSRAAKSLLDPERADRSARARRSRLSPRSLCCAAEDRERQRSRRRRSAPTRNSTACSRDRKWAGDPLFLMMAGLVAAKAGVREALSLSRADLAFSIAGR